MSTVTAIHIYPMKSTKGIALSCAPVEPWGLAGDRRWLLVDAEQKFVTQREHPVLATLSSIPDHTGLTLSAPGRGSVHVPFPARGEPADVTIWKSTVAAAHAGGADAWLSDIVGFDVRLVYLDDPTRRAVDPDYAAPGDTVSFADDFPLLLASTASLAALNGWLADDGHPALPMNRFRPNVVVDGFDPWAEDHWTLLRIGDVTFRSVKPCARCVVTTIDQETLAKGREPLRVLAKHRRVDQEVRFGQNLIPDHRGTIHLGDPVEILA
jgi:uncharacterized protein YcbX